MLGFLWHSNHLLQIPLLFYELSCTSPCSCLVLWVLLPLDPVKQAVHSAKIEWVRLDLFLAGSLSITGVPRMLFGIYPYLEPALLWSESCSLLFAVRFLKWQSSWEFCKRKRTGLTTCLPAACAVVPSKVWAEHTRQWVWCLYWSKRQESSIDSVQQDECAWV